MSLASDTIVLKLPPGTKARWVRQSQGAGMKLSDWVHMHVTRSMENAMVPAVTELDDAIKLTTSPPKRTAPWPDFAGSEIHEGDTIEHPDGDRGTVVYESSRDQESDRWRVRYRDLDNTLWLGLQIGDRGQARVVGREP